MFCLLTQRNQAISRDFVSFVRSKGRILLSMNVLKFQNGYCQLLVSFNRTQLLMDVVIRRYDKEKQVSPRGYYSVLPLLLIHLVHSGSFFALCGRVGPPILGGPPNFVKQFFKEQLYSVNLLHTISTICTLCTAAHAISDDGAAKMLRTALLAAAIGRGRGRRILAHIGPQKCKERPCVHSKQNH
jgi:hypothetical protein